jgi:hypothetical protein
VIRPVSFSYHREVFAWAHLRSIRFVSPSPLATSPMFGTFQQSQLRIEIAASAEQLSRAILEPTHLRRWMLPHVLFSNLSGELRPGLVFTSWLGPIPVEHQVERVEADSVRFILSRTVDGFHEWYWGEGWVQSCMEGISLAPLHLGNTSALLRLKVYVALLNRFQPQQSPHTVSR